MKIKLRNQLTSAEQAELNAYDPDEAIPSRLREWGGQWEDYTGPVKEKWVYFTEENQPDEGDTITLHEEPRFSRKIRTEVLSIGSLRTGNPGSGERNRRPVLVEVPENWENEN